MTFIARLCTTVPLACCLALSFVEAMSAHAEGLKKHNTYGSPLETLQNTHLTTDVPEAKDFVKATAPAKDKLDYTPLTGTDPVRPKPRDPKGIAALQAELESAGVKNEHKAKGMLPRKAAVPRKARATTASALPATREKP